MNIAVRASPQDEVARVDAGSVAATLKMFTDLGRREAPEYDRGPNGRLRVTVTAVQIRARSAARVLIGAPAHLYTTTDRRCGGRGDVSLGEAQSRHSNGLPAPAAATPFG